MKQDTDRIFYYHGAANPLGGRLTHPLDAVLEHSASTCVPQAGGQSSARIEKFNCNNMIRCEAAYSHSLGSVDQSTGNWKTLITSVAEGVNVFDTVTADRIVATIAIEHHREGYYPKCTFTGSQFENLRVNGQEVTANANPNLLDFNRAPEESDWSPSHVIEKRRDRPDWTGFPDRPWPFVANFAQFAAAQSDRILQSDAPQDIKNRFAWVPDAQQRQRRGYVLCSLVNEVQNVAPQSNAGHSSFGHVIDVPNLGRIFLGELIVDPLAFRLTMMRIEFGSLADGDVSFCSDSGNGVPMP